MSETRMTLQSDFDSLAKLVAGLRPKKSTPEQSLPFDLWADVDLFVQAARWALKYEAALTPADIKGTVRDSNCAALYYPWIRVFDPVSGASDVVPPSDSVGFVTIAGDSSSVRFDRGDRASIVIRGNELVRPVHRHRATEQEALALVAPHLDQPRELHGDCRSSGRCAMKAGEVDRAARERDRIDAGMLGIIFVLVAQRGVDQVARRDSRVVGGAV